jgi:hypothetical protein
MSQHMRDGKEAGVPTMVKLSQKSVDRHSKSLSFEESFVADRSCPLGYEVLLIGPDISEPRGMLTFDHIEDLGIR